MTADTPEPAGERPASSGGPTRAGGAPPSRDSIEGIDEIVSDWGARRDEEAERSARVEVERVQFLRGFERVVASVVYPTMQAAADRLTRDGGGGWVEAHDGDGSQGPKIILWMSLEGPISGTPREDRNPYLRLDADVPRRRIAVWEGDMWQRRGSSGPSTPWTLNDVSADAVTGQILEILRRAATHGIAPRPERDPGAS